MRAVGSGVETDQYKRHHAVIEFVRPETTGDRFRYLMRIKCVKGGVSLIAGPPLSPLVLTHHVVPRSLQ